MNVALVILAIVVLWAPGAVAQEPTQDEAYQELKELRQAMQDFRQDAELQMLVVDLMERGVSEEAAVELAAKIAEVFGDRPIKIESPAFGNRAGELDGIDSEKAHALVDQICSFRRDMLEKKLHWMEDRADGSRGPGSCRHCLNGVRDCIELVDTIYNNCIDSGLSLSYCLDLWLSLFGTCESQSDQCFADCGLPGGG